MLENVRVLEVARKTKPVKRTKQPAGEVAVKSSVCRDSWMQSFILRAACVASFFSWAAAVPCMSWIRRPCKHLTSLRLGE